MAEDDVAEIAIPHPVMLARSEVATFLSRQQATMAAIAVCPELPWAGIFAALEAAGLVAFLGVKPK